MDAKYGFNDAKHSSSFFRNGCVFPEVSRREAGRFFGRHRFASGGAGIPFDSNENGAPSSRLSVVSIGDARGSPTRYVDPAGVGERRGGWSASQGSGRGAEANPLRPNPRSWGKDDW